METWHLLGQFFHVWFLVSGGSVATRLTNEEFLVDVYHSPVLWVPQPILDPAELHEALLGLLRRGNVLYHCLVHDAAIKLLDLIIHVYHRFQISWIFCEGEYLTWKAVIDWIEAPGKMFLAQIQLLPTNKHWLHDIPGSPQLLLAEACHSELSAEVTGALLLRIWTDKIIMVTGNWHHLWVWCTLPHECCTCWAHGKWSSRSWRCTWRCRPGRCRRAGGRPGSWGSFCLWGMRRSPSHSWSSCTVCPGSGCPPEDYP